MVGCRSMQPNTGAARRQAGTRSDAESTGSTPTSARKDVKIIHFTSSLFQQLLRSFVQPFSRIPSYTALSPRSWPFWGRSDVAAALLRSHLAFGWSIALSGQTGQQVEQIYKGRFLSNPVSRCVDVRCAGWQRPRGWTGMLDVEQVAKVKTHEHC